jgi:4-amino-4-deoxy-L-arabinose transferase-like glycosyltransferase
VTATTRIRPAVALVVACLALFLGCVAVSWDKPLVGDMVPYLWWARAIVETGAPVIVFNPDDPPYPANMHPPLYPYLVALSFRLFGDGVRSSIYVNLAAFLATVVVTGVIARRLGAPPGAIALIVAVLLVHPFAIQSTLLTDTDTSILPLAVMGYTLLLLTVKDRMTLAVTLLLGLSFGVCLWAKFTTPLALPVVTALFLGLRGQPGPGLRAGAAILITGVAFFLGTHAAFAAATGLSPWEPIAWPATKARADLTGNLGSAFANVVATLKTDILWYTPPFVLLVLMALAWRARRYLRERVVEGVDLVWLLGWVVYLTYTVIIPTDGRPRYKTITLVLFTLASGVTLGQEAARFRTSRWIGLGAATVLAALVAYYAWLPEPIAAATLLSATADTAAKLRLIALLAVPAVLPLAGLAALRKWSAAVAWLLLALVATAIVSDVKQARAAAPHNLFGFGLAGFEETVAYVRSATRPGDIIFSFSDLPYYTRNRFYNYSVLRDGRRIIDVERLRLLAAAHDIRLLVFEIHPLRFGPALFAPREVQDFLRTDFCLLRRFGNHYVYGRRQAGLCGERG